VRGLWPKIGIGSGHDVEGVLPECSRQLKKAQHSRSHSSLMVGSLMVTSLILSLIAVSLIVRSARRTVSIDGLIPPALLNHRARLRSVILSFGQRCTFVRSLL
jgi:hypothetical protein